MSEQERCPKCGGMVYAEHYKDHWNIRCCQCDLHTNNFDSHSEARRAWDNKEWFNYHGEKEQEE